MPPDSAAAATVVLRLDEATELAAAWVHALAERSDIRSLLIKGKTLHLHGLRRERTSADVDVLVEPTRFNDLCEAIESAGWARRPGILIGEFANGHSATFVRDGWPCDLDVHSFYPGFLAESAQVFEALWCHRIVVRFANRDCLTLDKAASALVLGLHSLRGAASQQRHSEELEQLVSAPISDRERSDIAELARQTQCVSTLGNVLPRMGVYVEPAPAELAHPGLVEWRERTSSGSPGSYLWFVALRRAPWNHKALLVWWGFWPPRRDLLISRPDTVDSILGRLRARSERWGRGIRTAPKVVRALGPRLWHDHSDSP